MSNVDLFLKKVGINDKENLNSFPKEMFEKLESMSLDKYEFKYFDLSGYLGHYETINISEIAGSIGSLYSNKTWIHNFLNLDRLEKNCELALSNPDYYTSFMSSNADKNKFSLNNTTIELYKKNDKYYIEGGHHRLCILKLIYLTELEKIRKNPEQIDELKKKYSFNCFVRQLPKSHDFIQSFVKLCIKNHLFTIIDPVAFEYGFDENNYTPDFEMINTNYDYPTLRHKQCEFLITNIKDIDKFQEYLDDFKKPNKKI